MFAVCTLDKILKQSTFLCSSRDKFLGICPSSYCKGPPAAANQLAWLICLMSPWFYFFFSPPQAGLLTPRAAWPQPLGPLKEQSSCCEDPLYFRGAGSSSPGYPPAGQVEQAHGYCQRCMGLLESGESLGLAGLSPKLVLLDFKGKTPQLNWDRNLPYSSTNILCVVFCCGFFFSSLLLAIDRMYANSYTRRDTQIFISNQLNVTEEKKPKAMDLF